jgi:putative Mg2+ transporter-C (MgtC) family protein
VAVGACSFVTVGALNFPATTGQLIGGIVTGVGFLGVGMIFRARGGHVHGLTSAAGLWVTAAIGVVTGVGYPFAATGLTGVILLLLMWDKIPVIKSIGPYEHHAAASNQAPPAPADPPR